MTMFLFILFFIGVVKSSDSYLTYRTHNQQWIPLEKCTFSTTSTNSATTGYMITATSGKDKLSLLECTVDVGSGECQNCRTIITVDVEYNKHIMNLFSAVSVYARGNARIIKFTDLPLFDTSTEFVIAQYDGLQACQTKDADHLNFVKYSGKIEGENPYIYNCNSRGLCRCENNEVYCQNDICSPFNHSKPLFDCATSQPAHQSAICNPSVLGNDKYTGILVEFSLESSDPRCKLSTDTSCYIIDFQSSVSGTFIHENCDSDCHTHCTTLIRNDYQMNKDKQVQVDVFNDRDGGLFMALGTEKMEIKKGMVNSDGSYDELFTTKIMAQFPQESYLYSYHIPTYVTCFPSIIQGNTQYHRSVCSPNGTVQIFRYTDSECKNFDSENVMYDFTCGKIESLNHPNEKKSNYSYIWITCLALLAVCCCCCCVCGQIFVVLVVLIGFFCLISGTGITFMCCLGGGKMGYEKIVNN